MRMMKSSRPKGPPGRRRGPEGTETSSFINILSEGMNKILATSIVHLLMEYGVYGLAVQVWKTNSVKYFAGRCPSATQK